MNELFDVLNESGEYTNKIVNSGECYKAVAVFIISNYNKKVLLQLKRCNEKVITNL